MLPVCSPDSRRVALAQRASLLVVGIVHPPSNIASCADHRLDPLVQPPNLSTSNLTQSSPRGVKRSRSLEVQGDSLGYDDGMWQARTRLLPFTATRSYTNCFG